MRTVIAKPNSFSNQDDPIALMSDSEATQITGNSSSGVYAAKPASLSPDYPATMSSKAGIPSSSDQQQHQQPLPGSGSSANVGAVSIRSTDKTILANKGFTLKHTVGSGSYSKVKVAIRIRSSSATEKYAFKIIDRSKAPKDFQEKFLPRELEIWPQIKHPNIIRMYTYFEHDPKIYMLLEYAEGGDVLDHVQKSGALSQRQARTWIKQILDAVYYLHRLGIAHRDLKLENILIDDKFNVKICDFGFAKMDIVNPSATFCGSKAYAAPEILAGECTEYFRTLNQDMIGQEYSPTKADVWAIGVILYIFVTGTMPFNEEYKNRVILQAQQNLAFPWKNFVNVTAECKNLILSMFTYDFVERPEISAVVRDPWFDLEKPMRPKFSARPKSRSSTSGSYADARGGDADSVRPSLSVESGVQTSPRMPTRQSFAGYYSQKPRMKQQVNDSSGYRQPQHPHSQQQSRHLSNGGGVRGNGTSTSYGSSQPFVGSGFARSAPEERRSSYGNGGGRTSTGNSSHRVTRAVTNGKSPSPLAEPPRPKRIWLNGGISDQHGGGGGYAHNSNNNNNLGYTDQVRNHYHHVWQNPTTEALAGGYSTANGTASHLPNRYISSNAGSELEHRGL